MKLRQTLGTPQTTLLILPILLCKIKEKVNAPKLILYQGNGAILDV